MLINSHVFSWESKLQASTHKAHSLQAGMRAEQRMQHEPPGRQALPLGAGWAGLQGELHAQCVVRPLFNVCGARMQPPQQGHQVRRLAPPQAA